MKNNSAIERAIHFLSSVYETALNSDQPILQLRELGMSNGLNGDFSRQGDVLIVGLQGVNANPIVTIRIKVGDRFLDLGISFENPADETLLSMSGDRSVLMTLGYQRRFGFLRAWAQTHLPRRVWVPKPGRQLAFRLWRTTQVS